MCGKPIGWSRSARRISCRARGVASAGALRSEGAIASVVSVEIVLGADVDDVGVGGRRLVVSCWWPLGDTSLAVP